MIREDELPAQPTLDLDIFSTLLSGMSEGVVVTTPDGRIVHSNQAFQAITGYAEAEMFGRTCGFLQGAETDPGVVAEIADAVAAGRAYRGEILNYRKSGAPFWNELTITPVFAPDRRPKYFIGIMRDVTDRKSEGVKLEALEAQYRFMFDNVRAGIVLHKANTEVIFANRMASQLLGMNSDSMIGAVDTDERWQFIREDGALLPIEDYPVNRAVAAGVLVSDMVLGNFRVSDGKLLWLLCNAYPVFDKDGVLDRVLVSFIDVTSLKLADANLRESEERYRLLADNANDLILRYDLQGRIAYASPSFRRYGYEPAAMIGREVGWIARPDYKDRAIQRFRDVLAGLPDRSDAWPVDVADGRSIWLEGRLAPFYDASGAISGVLSAIRDVSERVAAEVALREVNAELVRVTRISALGVFTASLAHEINQPLAALAMNSETAMVWLSRDPPGVDKAMAAVRRAGQDARRASDIVQRLRGMVTKERSNVSQFALNDAVREIMSLTQVEQRRAGVSVKLELAKGGSTVRGDRIQIQQVLMNLIINAIESMADTPPEARRLKVRTAHAGDGGMRVEVADHGGGVDPAATDRIFDHLFTTKAGGTGLGLAISKTIVEAHGGRIWAEAATPQGAVFCFEIPKGAG